METTAQILVKDGYHGLTTNHVARRAGVSIGTIYQYFRSKEELVAMLAQRHIERLAAVVVQELAVAVDEPFIDGVHRIVSALVRAQMIDADLHRALLQQLPSEGRAGSGGSGGTSKLREMDQQLVTLLHTALEAQGDKLDAETDTRMLAFLLVHVTKGVSLGALLDHPQYLRGDRIADELARMFTTYAAAKSSRFARKRP